MNPSMIVSVEVIVERDGRYLMITRSQDEDFGAGWITFPGGKVEPHDTGRRALEVTAQRELMEEVGMEVAVEDLRYVESHIFSIGDMPVLDVVMVTRNAIGEPHTVDPTEVARTMWMTANEVAEHPDVPEWTRDSLVLAIT